MLRDLIDKILSPYLFFKTWLEKTRRYEYEVGRYYRNSLFKVLDLKLKYYYKNLTPYKISKEYQGEFPNKKHLYLYGETPLDIYEKIATKWLLKPNDRFLELGSGIGRGGFFLSSFFYCRYVGVEWIERYTKFAQNLKKMHRLENVDFECRDMYEISFENFDWIYLFGSCLKDPEIEKLCDKLSRESKSAKIITVSYPLSDYASCFKTLDQIEADFEFGKTTMYLQEYSNRSC